MNYFFLNLARREQEMTSESLISALFYIAY